MQTTRSQPKREGGVGSTIALLLLGLLLLGGVAMYCLTQLVPNIESDLTQRVTTAVANAGLKANNVKVQGTDVTLVGTIDSPSGAAEAEKLARDVYGVANVYNELDGTGSNNDAAESPLAEKDAAETDSGPSADESSATPVRSAIAVSKDAATDASTEKKVSEDTADQKNDSGLDDSLIEQSQKANDLTSSPPPSDALVVPSSLEVVVKDGKAVVLGVMPDTETTDRIITAVTNQFGRDNVKNKLSVFATSQPPVWLDGAIAVISTMDKIENPSLKIANDEATVGGIASSETLGAQQLASARRQLGDSLTVAGAFDTSPRISELPAPEQKPRLVKKRPASLKIDSSTGGARLTGIVTSVEQAETVREGLSQLLGAGNYSDELIIDDSVASANWISEALDVARNVKDVDNFSVSINSGQMMLGGDIANREVGKTLTGTAEKLVNSKLTVVNNYAVNQAELVLESREEVLARELNQKLVALPTNKIVFKPGSANLAPDAKDILDQVAGIISGYAGQIVEISGHTDASGDPVNNLELSKRRAIAVRDYLVEKGLPGKQLRPIGYGESKPVANNSTPAGRAANRRIEFNL